MRYFIYDCYLQITVERGLQSPERINRTMRFEWIKKSMFVLSKELLKRILLNDNT